jgi:uncharacterized protein YunC (DUF1805 family)
MTTESNMTIPAAEQRELSTPHGTVIGASYAWDGGQYCVIHTARGVVGCGIFDIACADTFGMAFAIARGTPEHPLRKPEDLYEANLVEVSEAAKQLGIRPGMTGMQAIGKLLSAIPNTHSPPVQ